MFRLRALLPLLCVLGMLSASVDVPGADPAPRRRTRTPPQPATPVGEPYDLVFLGPDGAVLFRVVVDTGKRSIADTRRDYADVVFRTLDADASSQLDPAEAVKIPQNGQISANAPTLGDGWKALDTNPADESISPDELFAFVDAQLGPRFRLALSIKPQQSVRLHELDTNGDTLISLEEIQTGLSTLSVNDFEDDGTLSIAELQPYPTAMRQAIQQLEADESRDLPLMVLMSDADRAAAQERLLAYYGTALEGSSERRIPTQKVGGMTVEGVSEHDANGDGALDGQELAKLLASDARRLTIGVQIQRSRVQMPDVASLALVESSQRGAANEALPLRLAGMPVKVQASNNRQGGASDAETVANFAGNQFQQADADNNDYLDANEFLQLRGMLQTIPLPDVEFAGIDANSDGMVQLSEVKSYAQTNAGLAEATLVLTVSDDAKTLFDILDANIDFRLSPREFLEGAIRVRKYDHDKDGRFGPAEMRSEFALKVSRARPQFLNQQRQNPAGMQASGVPRIAPGTSGPTWFRKMDRNQDDDVAWREFLGQRGDFDRIDADRNGLIDLNEATAAE